MGLLDGKEIIKTIILREDYTGKVENIQVDDFATNVITKKRNSLRDVSWLLIHELLKPIYGFPGIPDGTAVLLITPRDIKFDPLHQLGEEWDDENIRGMMEEIAKEQEYKAEESKHGTTLSKSQAWLSAAAFILTLGILAIILLKRFHIGG